MKRNLAGHKVNLVRTIESISIVRSAMDTLPLTDYRQREHLRWMLVRLENQRDESIELIRERLAH